MRTKQAASISKTRKQRDNSVRVAVESDQDLLFVEECVARLGLGKNIKVRLAPVTGHARADYSTLSIEETGGTTRFALQVHRHPKQSVEMMIQKARAAAKATGLQPLLLSTHLGDKNGERLRDEGIKYLDSAGNAWLETPTLRLWHRGFKAPKRVGRTSRLYGAAGLKLVAVLLASLDAINWPYRELARVAGISLSTTSDLIDELQANSFLRPLDKTRRTVINRNTLFQQWELMYPGLLRPKLSPRSYRSMLPGDKAALHKHLPKDLTSTVLIGGEVAAGQLTGYLNPHRLSLHCLNPDAIPALRTALRLVPDAQGDIDLLTHFSQSEIWRWQDTRLIHPLFIHAELLAFQPDSRLLETAELIYKSILKSMLVDEK